MDQWMESCKIYDQETVNRKQDPLTEAEKNLLDSLTLEDWKKLDAARDSESKLRLTVRAPFAVKKREPNLFVVFWHSSSCLRNLKYF